MKQLVSLFSILTLTFVLGYGCDKQGDHSPATVTMPKLQSETQKLDNDPGSKVFDLAGNAKNQLSEVTAGAKDGLSGDSDIFQGVPNDTLDSLMGETKNSLESLTDEETASTSDEIEENVVDQKDLLGSLL